MKRDLGLTTVHRWMAAGVLAAASWATPVTAATVYEDVDFMFSSSVLNTQNVGAPGGVATKVGSFEITSPGTYKATLADFTFPEHFKQLGLSVTTFVDEKMDLGSVFGEGSFFFNAAAPGIYYASVFGQPGDTYGVGLFGVQVAEFAGTAVVPLPPAVLFLASGLAVFAAFGRGGKRVDDEDGVVLDAASGALPA